jgi:hypothetical protein
VLFNTAGPASPDAAALAIAEDILGPAPSDEVALDGDASRFSGTYAGKGRGQATEISFLADGATLAVKAPMLGDTARKLSYVGNDTFRVDEIRFVFLDGGKRVRLDAGYANNLLSRK